MAAVETKRAHERDYLETTIATVRQHQSNKDNCWPQWANIFADEIERLWTLEATHREELREAIALALAKGGTAGVVGDAVPQGTWDALHERGLCRTTREFSGDAVTYTTPDGAARLVDLIGGAA